MGIAAADEIEMEVHPDLVAEGLHEIVHQLRLESAHPLLRDRHVVGEVASTADVDNNRAQRFVQRHHRLAEAPNARAIAERLAKGAPEHDADVLDRVMLVDMEVAACLDHEIEETMAGGT